MAMDLVYQNDTIPISQLSPLSIQSRIIVRVIRKNPIHEYYAGVRFTMDLMDIELTEIRIVAFNKECYKFYDMIKEGEIYIFSKCIVKKSNEEYYCRNKYELELTNEAIVQPLKDDGSIPNVKIGFTSITKIHKMDAPDTIDIIGYCYSVGDLVTGKSMRAGREYTKRELKLTDFNKNVRWIYQNHDVFLYVMNYLSLWGQDANFFNHDLTGKFILVKNARINEYRGSNELSLADGALEIIPNFPVDVVNEFV